MGRKLRFNFDAFREIRHDPRVVAELDRRARAIEAACNGQSSWGGYEAEVDEEGSRPRARVWSISGHAREDNARSQRLIRNLEQE